MEFALVQYAAGDEAERMLELGAPLWAFWLTQQGFDAKCHRFATGRRYPERTPHWEKVAYWIDMADALPDGALMWCADVDALPRRVYWALYAMHSQADVGMVWTESGRFWNSGIVPIRVSAKTRRWLRDVWDAGQDTEARSPGEQGRINSSLGYKSGVPRKFPERDQITPCETTAGTLAVYRLHERWNAYPRVRCFERPPVIQAWHGVAQELRLAEMQAVRTQFDAGGGLWAL